MIRNNATLKARIERLEKRTSTRRFPRMTFGLFDRDDSEIIGAEADIVGSAPIRIMRQPDEATSALIERAYATTGALSVRIVYQARQIGQERDYEASGSPSSAKVAERAPSAVPGVGVRATADQLRRLGATFRQSVPERPL